MKTFLHKNLGEEKKVKRNAMPSDTHLQSQLSRRLRQEELKFKGFLGFKVHLSNSERPSFKIKNIKEGRGLKA